MFALSKGLITLRNLIAKCMVYLHPRKDVTFIDSKCHPHNEVTLPNDANLTVQNDLQNADIQYPVPALIAYQHQIVSRHPTLSMDEPRLSSLPYERGLTPTPPPSSFTRSPSFTSDSFTPSTHSQAPVRRVPLDKGVIVDIPFYGTYRLENYKCVLYNGQPYIKVEGLRLVSPLSITTSHLLVPWGNFDISHEVLGWTEWIKLQSWYITVPIHRPLGRAISHLCYTNDEESVLGVYEESIVGGGVYEESIVGIAV